MSAPLWVPRAVDADGVRERVRVHIADGRIEGVEEGVPPGRGDARFADAMLVPGLVDLQVNGGDGAAYDAEDPTARERATRFHVGQGTTSLLATLVSAPVERLAQALRRLRADVRPDGPVVGIHLEGPFLAREKAGAHDPEALCDPTPEAVAVLLAAAGSALRLVTLAPELPGAPDAIERFARAGAIVAAGHTRAGTACLRDAIERGLSFATHVGNASEWPSRPYDAVAGYRRSEPGLVGTFLFEPRLRGSLILDGHHLHPELARALVELRGPESVLLVSDATPATGRPPGRYRLGGLDVEIHAGGYATAGEGLAGSTIPLVRALEVAVCAAGIPLPDAVRMATATPAELLGLGGRKGRLRPGMDADLLVLGEDWRPRAVYRAGLPV